MTSSELADWLVANPAIAEEAKTGFDDIKAGRYHLMTRNELIESNSIAETGRLNAERELAEAQKRIVVLEHLLRIIIRTHRHWDDPVELRRVVENAATAIQEA